MAAAEYVVQADPEPAPQLLAPPCKRRTSGQARLLQERCKRGLISGVVSRF